jgi:hypothetical protein
MASEFAVDLLQMQQAGNKALSFWLLPYSGNVKPRCEAVVEAHAR